jgi:phosphatidylethanolamine-binding protein (PEBP) family uncharacterized protein
LTRTSRGGQPARSVTGISRGGASKRIGPPRWTDWPSARTSSAAVQLSRTVEGTNDFGKPGYGGPSPPPGGPHCYCFKLTALSVELKQPAGAKRQDVIAAMDGHVLGEDWLMGTYGRKGE